MAKVREKTTNELINAAENGDIDAVKSLIEGGINANAANSVCLCCVFVFAYGFVCLCWVC